MSLRRSALVLSLIVAVLLVNASAASALRAYNQTPVTIVDNTGVVPAPSVGMRAPGTISSMYLAFNGLTHAWPKDLDIALESPSGKVSLLMSDACGGTPLSNASFEINQESLWPLFPEFGACSGGIYRPANYEAPLDTFTSAPGASLSLGLDSFTGEDPNGIWKLHIQDDSQDDSGSLASWTLNVESYVDPSLGYTRVPATGGGSSTDVAVVMSKEIKLPRPIADVDVVLKDLSHRFPEDLNILLVSPAGSGVVLMSDACGSISLLRSNFRFDDAAPTMLPDEGNVAECQPVSATVKPSDAETLETAIAGAPAGPYSPGLGVFNGQSATGTWRLYLLDDQAGSEAYIKDFELAITQVPTKQLKVGRASLKYKKSGKKKILASGRVALSGATLATGECAGTAKTTFQTKSTRKKGKKRVTVYKRVGATNSRLRLVKGKCEVSVSAKLAKKYSGKKLRLVVQYQGGDYLSPFKRNLSVKVKRLKFS